MASMAVARDVVRDLRHKIAKIEGRLAERFEETQETAGNGALPRGFPGPSVRTGVERLDAVLGGGPAVSRADRGACECGPAKPGRRQASFWRCCVGCRWRKPPPLLWIGTSEIFREAGRPYAPGLAEGFGLQPENLLIAEAEKLLDVLRIAEEAARLDAFLAVLLEIRGTSPILDLDRYPPPASPCSARGTLGLPDPRGGWDLNRRPRRSACWLRGTGRAAPYAGGAACRLDRPACFHDRQQEPYRYLPPHPRWSGTMMHSRKDTTSPQRILALWFPYLPTDRLRRQRFGRSWRSRSVKAMPLVLSRRDSDSPARRRARRVG